jgi:hypothetical protein
MKKAILFLIAIIAIDVAIQVYLTTRLTMAQRQADELEVRMKTLEYDVADRTMEQTVADPAELFNLIQSHDKWEEIDAVPYSKCFRHLIGTTTADFIVCQAI